MSTRLTRTTVIAQAADLCDEIGLGELTFTRLAPKLGIATPGIYRHARDLNDLTRGISARACLELTAEIDAATAGLSGQAALTGMGLSLRSWAHRHPGRYEAVQIAPEPDEDEHQDAAANLLGAIERALRGYGLSDDDSTDAVRVVRSMIHGFIHLEAQGGFKLPASTDASFARLLVGADTILRSWV